MFECNDGYLNDIQAMAVQESHYQRAFDDAGVSFAQGSVGAGRGTSSFLFKGGIGTASRVTGHDTPQPWTVGALVLSNFGRRPNLTIAGRAFG